MNLINKILDIIFPKECGICGKLGEYICQDCYNKLKKLEMNKCKNNIFFIYKYEGIVRETILKYKFEDKSYLFRTYSNCLQKNKKLYRFLEKYDIIIPVPLHKKRLLERGYNQSNLIAKELIKITNNKMILLNDVLLKTVNIKPQSTKKVEERKKDVCGIYKVVNNEKIKQKRVLIFDDIYTTGSTCNECKKVLEEAGCKTVGILTLARD